MLGRNGLFYPRNRFLDSLKETIFPVISSHFPWITLHVSTRKCLFKKKSLCIHTWIHDAIIDNIIKTMSQRCLAEKRLEGTLKKIERHGQVREYAESMAEMLAKGYAEPVPRGELKLSPGKVWYLPHHAVLHPVKKKLRIVFDCAAMQKGVSLNNSCLAGPDLTTKLVNVLLRFRKYDVAVTADVKAMYMQVKLPSQDRDCLRFLWKPAPSDPVMEYRMCSHVFGGVWCAATVRTPYERLSRRALKRCLRRRLYWVRCTWMTFWWALLQC